jgi:2-dehydro-3-deoxy-D-gluconate 5-dehydrogenase
MSQNILSLFRIDGTIAFITGAGRGIGKAVTLALAEAGADVVLIGRDESRLTGTAREVEALGRRSLVLPADVSDTTAIQAAVAQTIERMGPIDILVNNAGIIRRAPAVDHSDEDWNAVLNVNLNAVFRLSREVGRGMVERKRGKIINIASLLSFQGGLTVPSYAASKGGVHILTKSLANEWSQHNVQVNAIAPGYIVTDNTQPLRENEQRYREITSRIPAGRWGNPDDLKGAVVFLASSASDYVSGHTLVVDGGWMGR